MEIWQRRKLGDIERNTHTSTEYGGTNAVLCWKNRALDTCGTSRMTSVPFSAFFPSISPLSLFFFNLASFCPIMRFTWRMLECGVEDAFATRKKDCLLRQTCGFVLQSPFSQSSECEEGGKKLWRWEYLA